MSFWHAFGPGSGNGFFSAGSQRFDQFHIPVLSGGCSFGPEAMKRRCVALESATIERISFSGMLPWAFVSRSLDSGLHVQVFLMDADRESSTADHYEVVPFTKSNFGTSRTSTHGSSSIWNITDFSFRLENPKVMMEMQ